MGMSAELLPEFDLEMASARRTLERIPEDKLCLLYTSRCV